MDKSTRRRIGSQEGSALLLVVVLLVVVAGAVASFIWLMNQQQARAGLRYRSAAALSLAEAGVYQTLAVLESGEGALSPPGRTWRPTGHTETRLVGTLQGRFTLSAIDQSDGAIILVGTGEVAGVTRRVRVRVYLASQALLAAIYTPSVLRFQPRPAATFILPYGRQTTEGTWIHVAVGQEVLLRSTNVSLNDPSSPVDAAPGPVDSGGDALWPPGPEPVRIMLASTAELTIYRRRDHVDVQQLRAIGLNLAGSVVRTPVFPDLPEVDRAYYRARAAANTANAVFNQAAGKHLGNAELAEKRDSLYSSDEFDQLLSYLEAGVSRPRLRGVVYVMGAVVLVDGQELSVSDGAFIVEGALFVSRGASLEITHTGASRELPGVIVLDEGSVIVREEGRLRAHGLVYSAGGFTVAPRALVDIVGVLAARDPAVGINLGGSVVIRYDPAVLGTPGLRTPPSTPVIAWVASWEELP